MLTRRQRFWHRAAVPGRCIRVGCGLAACPGCCDVLRWKGQVPGLQPTFQMAQGTQPLQLLIYAAGRLPAPPAGHIPLSSALEVFDFHSTRAADAKDPHQRKGPLLHNTAQASI